MQFTRDNNEKGNPYLWLADANIQIMFDNAKNMVISGVGWMGNSVQRVDRYFAILENRKRNPTHYFHPKRYLSTDNFSIHFSKTDRVHF
jgi:hypothetical protein